ncbi:hypothetical protein [Limnospira platensis]|nr:hypothetical protein AP9108_11975 [Arthrospira sp. PCC 9108]QQW31204.1 hypothetical protein AP9108_11980 [Arthrospira sp. PCC 9108]
MLWEMVRQVAICFLWVIIFAGLTHPTVWYALGNGASGGYMLPLGDNICRSDAPYGLVCFGKWCVR